MPAEFLVPSEIIIDMADASGQNKADRAIYFTDELAQALPRLPEAFDAADLSFEKAPYELLSSLENSVFRVEHEGVVAICSLRYNAGSSRSEYTNVTTHGFSDYSPQSTAESIYKYI